LSASIPQPQPPPTPSIRFTPRPNRTTASWSWKSWDATRVGLVCGGAHVILLPEIPFTVQNISDYMARRESYDKRFMIVVVAEAVQLPSELRHMSRRVLIGNTVGDAIALLAHKDVRVSVLGQIQHGGSPPRSTAWSQPALEWPRSIWLAR